VRHTPVVSVDGGPLGSRHPVVLKLDTLQHSGSFKVRGAFHRLLSVPVPPDGVLAASGGNHGAAVAYAARALGHRAEIFVPTIASPIKVERLRRYGAHLTLVGRNYGEAYAASQERAAACGALFVHAFDQPDVVAGQGTAARELEAQAPDLTTVLVAVGGGGLVGGVAAHYAGRVRVVGVETEGCPALHRALAAGAPVDVEVGGIAADSLGARRIGETGFALARRFVQDAVLVSDAAVREAQRFLWEEARVVAEPGGATALAALLSGAYVPGPDERVGVIVCGGNADLAPLLPPPLASAP
jgi:threonine dehydratase